MGLELLELTAERVVGRMPVEGNTQPFGLWHGGASCVLAETLASLGSYAHGRPNRIGVGVDLNATHHRPAPPAGSPARPPPSAWAAPSSSTRSSSLDDAGQRICTARVTCQLVEGSV